MQPAARRCRPELSTAFPNGRIDRRLAPAAFLSSAPRRPRNPQIAVLLCIDARSPLHEDASAYPRLLSVLQRAPGARSRAGEEPPAVGAPGRAAAVPTRDRRLWRLPPPETRGPREADE